MYQKHACTTQFNNSVDLLLERCSIVSSVCRVLANIILILPIRVRYTLDSELTSSACRSAICCT